LFLLPAPDVVGISRSSVTHGARNMCAYNAAIKKKPALLLLFLLAPANVMKTGRTTNRIL
jgi:hypothetical protein